MIFLSSPGQEPRQPSGPVDFLRIKSRGAGERLRVRHPFPVSCPPRFIAFVVPASCVRHDYRFDQSPLWRAVWDKRRQGWREAKTTKFWRFLPDPGGHTSYTYILDRKHSAVVGRGRMGSNIRMTKHVREKTKWRLMLSLSDYLWLWHIPVSLPAFLDELKHDLGAHGGEAQLFLNLGSKRTRPSSIDTSVKMPKFVNHQVLLSLSSSGRCSRICSDSTRLL